MSSKLTKERLLNFLKRLGERARSQGNCYLTGGTSAVLIGWRDTTIDIDLKFDPEPAGVFEAIPALKKELAVNVELASPDDFIPPLPFWKERSQVIGTFGLVQVFHYDFVAQALSKLSRGHDQDLRDVDAMLTRKLATKDQVLMGLADIRPHLNRYPAIDENLLIRRVNKFFDDYDRT